jgi:hypothetical protein
MLNSPSYDVQLSVYSQPLVVPPLVLLPLVVLPLVVLVLVLLLVLPQLGMAAM